MKQMVCDEWYVNKIWLLEYFCVSYKNMKLLHIVCGWLNLCILNATIILYQYINNIKIERVNTWISPSHSSNPIDFSKYIHLPSLDAPTTWPRQLCKIIEKFSTLMNVFASQLYTMLVIIFVFQINVNNLIIITW